MMVLDPEVNDLDYKALVSKVRRITPPDKSSARPSEDERRVLPPTEN